MRWIRDDEFKTIFLLAKTCTFIDSARESTTLKRLVFDDASTCTYEFGDMLLQLMQWSGDPVANYIVLDPDPVHYFHRLFNKYPVLEIAVGDTSADYLKFLNEDPGGSPGDAVGTNFNAWAIVPPSLKWFVHALRSSDDEGGHLWVPAEWCPRLRGMGPWVAPWPKCE